jgi:hypothetical protein
MAFTLTSLRARINTRGIPEFPKLLYSFARPARDFEPTTRHTSVTL